MRFVAQGPAPFLAHAEHESATPVGDPEELLYEQMKREWKVAHRDAPTEEYDAAIRVIVAVCGV